MNVVEKLSKVEIPFSGILGTIMVVLLATMIGSLWAGYLPLAGVCGAVLLLDFVLLIASFAMSAGES